MIISRTPLRISFAGGGSDLPAFYRREPGAVTSTTINKYIYIAVNRKFDRKIRASYSVTEIVDNLDDLKHELIRESLRLVGIDRAIEIVSISDIPSGGTGLGSSSSYTVGLLNALYAYKGMHVGAERLAREACEVEIDMCGKPIGKQDQYIAAYGGLQHIQFNPDESVFVDPIICNSATKQTLEQNLILFYTRQTRSADSILSEQVRNIDDGSRMEAQRNMVDLARWSRGALCRNDLSHFGEILHKGWIEKKWMASSITNLEIDRLYEKARQKGALGGKITGAGGGGFLLLYVPRLRQDSLLRAMALDPVDLVAVRLEPQGSKIIYVE